MNELTKESLEENISLLAQKEQEIREFYNQSTYFQRELKNNAPGNLNKLCCSLDTIGDSCVVMNEFISKKQHSGYLYIFGILQVLYTQQDAVKHLIQSFELDELLSVYTDGLDEKGPYGDLGVIREIRNRSIAHPTDGKITKKILKFLLLL